MTDDKELETFDTQGILSDLNSQKSYVLNHEGLCRAIIDQNLEAIRDIVATQGIEINKTRAAISAIEIGNKKIYDYLIESGANITLDDLVRQAFRAIHTGNRRMLNFVIGLIFPENLYSIPGKKSASNREEFLAHILWICIIKENFQPMAELIYQHIKEIDETQAIVKYIFSLMFKHMIISGEPETFKWLNDRIPLKELNYAASIPNFSSLTTLAITENKHNNPEMSFKTLKSLINDYQLITPDKTLTEEFKKKFPTAQNEILQLNELISDYSNKIESEDLSHGCQLI